MRCIDGVLVCVLNRIHARHNFAFGVLVLQTILYPLDDCNSACMIDDPYHVHGDSPSPVS